MKTLPPTLHEPAAEPRQAVGKTPPRSSQAKTSYQSPSAAKAGFASRQPPAVEQDAEVEDIYDLLADAIRRDFPEIDLCQHELMDLSQTVLDIRNALADLRNLQRGAEDSADRQRLEDQRDKALWDFKQIAGMSFAEFMRRAPADGGIDDDGDSEGDEVILEPIDGS